jgi:hypothetical protein
VTRFDHPVPRFADGWHLQGFFHPRHTLADVYNWVQSCLLPASVLPAPGPELMSGGAGSKKLRTGEADPARSTPHIVHIFELYQSPPYRSLVYSEPAALIDLGFAPAAVLNLSWRPGCEPSKLNTSSDLVSYLRPELLTPATVVAASTVEGKSGEEGEERVRAIAFPTGKELVEKKVTEDMQQRRLAAEARKSETGRKEEGEKHSTRKLPSWLNPGGKR